MEKRVFNMVEACHYLGGISRQTMYRLMGEGQINSLHIGVRRFFPREDLEKFINDRLDYMPQHE